jgi:hypothetical protein
MFCDRCGTPFGGTESFCASCGKQFRPIPAPRPALGRVEGHVRNLGMFWLAYSAFRLASGWLFSHYFAHWGLFWDPRVPFFLPHLMHGVGAMLMFGGVLGILAGWGLLERQPWARTLAIVLGFFALFHFGVGTVLGIYTLWVLLPAESAVEYQRTARVV